MEYLIEIAGTCNLRCPSCPVGNYADSDFAGGVRKKGFMEFALFERILDKAQTECVSCNDGISVSLYNWGEALLHPDLAKFVALLAARKVPFNLSSNLNTEVPLDQIVRADPAHFRISMSGFTNMIYQKGHRGGDVNLVISNMYRLRYAIDKQKKNTIVQVFYHVYKDNCGDELLAVAKLSETLGFEFQPAWAYFSPIEKVIDYVTDSQRLSDTDRATLGRLVIPMSEALEMSKQVHSPECILRNNQTVINHDGSVALCCGVYDPRNFIAENYLEVSRDELQQRKFGAEICSVCMSHGIYDAAAWQPNDRWDAAGLAKQIAAGQPYGIRMFTAPHILPLEPPVNPVLEARRDSLVNKCMLRFGGWFR